jgi:hypothetical protein
MIVYIAIIRFGQSSLGLFGFVEFVPGILVVACPELLPDQVACFVRKPIKILSVEDSLLDYFDELNLFEVILIQVVLVLIVGRLLDEGEVCEVPYVRLHHSHYHLLRVLVVELIVNKNSPN